MSLSLFCLSSSLGCTTVIYPPSFFLAITMKTGLLFLMKRGPVCSPPWLQVSSLMLNDAKMLFYLCACLYVPMLTG